MCLNDMLLTRSFRVGSAEPQVIDPVIQNVQPDDIHAKPLILRADVPRQIQPAQTIHSHSQNYCPLTGGPVDQIVHNQKRLSISSLHNTSAILDPEACIRLQLAHRNLGRVLTVLHLSKTHMAPQMLPRPQPYVTDSWDGSYDHSSQGAGPIVGVQTRRAMIIGIGMIRQVGSVVQMITTTLRQVQSLLDYNRN